MSPAEPAFRTPGELLRERGELSDDVVAARSGGRVVDLHTPLPANTNVEPVRTRDPQALQVIRHSAAHVMAV
jgi:threonyl-tRNA synthetase